MGAHRCFWGGIVPAVLALLLPAAAVRGNYDYITEPLVGFHNIRYIISNDTFRPLSFFSPGETETGLLYARYAVDTLIEYDSGITNGEDMTGSAASLFGARAFSKRMAVFSLLEEIGIRGDAVYIGEWKAGYRGHFDIPRNDVFTFMCGVAYDVIDDTPERRISVPFYATLMYSRHRVDMTYTDTDGNIFYIEDDNHYLNLLLGVAVSFRVAENMRITPYVLAGIWNATTPHVTRVSPREEYDERIDEGIYLHGLEFFIRAGARFSCSISLAGTYQEINPVTRSMIHGLRMRSICVSVGYVL